MAIAVACGPDATESGSNEPLWDDVEVDLDGPAIRFGAGALAGIELGIEDAYDESVNHDPWNLYADPGAVPAVRWEAATTARWADRGLLLELEDGSEACITRPDGEGFLLEYLGDAVASYVRLSFASPSGEGIYGLGESFAAVNQRGRVRAMQIELDLEIESGYSEEHLPVPFVVGSSGWGAGIETDWPTAFDVASVDPERVVAVSNAPEGLAFSLYEDEDPVQVVAAWTRRQGLPKMPPDWAFGPFIWRDEDSPEDVVRADAAAIRDGDFAFSVMWIDNPWQTTYNSMEPDPAQFPEWDDMVESLHALGFRWMAWTTPYVDDDDPEHDLYESNGWFADAQILFNGFGDLVDLTNPDAMAAWQGRVSAARDRGVEGWKLDYGEDAQLGFGSGRVSTKFWNGSDERTMHHRFGAYYHTAYAAPYDADSADRFLLGRSGAWGTAAITDCIWPGDLCNDLSTFKGEPHDDDLLSVGGLPAAIRAGVSLGSSGFPCFASDTGGYRHGRANQETIIRWTEYSATLPVMQVGGGNQHNYWLLDGDWTEAVPEAGRKYTILHTRLFPYFQGIMNDAATQGTPTVRPLGLSGGDTDDVAFLVGDSLFVAPVEEEDATSRIVSFPPGTWVHWWTGDAWEGEEEVDAPLGEGPFFIREGGIVPMLRESVRSLAPSDGSVDSWADDPGPLVVRFVPGEGTFHVVDGPEMTGTASSLAVGDLGIYTGASVEVWASGASRLLVDGREVVATTDGTWLSGETGAGTVTWE